MASSKAAAVGRAPGSRLGPPPMSPEEKMRARAHIAEAAEAQRAARGTAEQVSAPKLRQAGRRVQLWGIWLWELLGGVARRVTDSHRWPGRPARRVLLLRPTQTVTPWVLVWIAAVAGCSYVLAEVNLDDTVEWFVKWGLAAAFGAFVASIWHDGVKSPYLAYRIRRRVISNPGLLLGETLAEQGTKIIELDPPVNTVPRDDLYEELFPGVLPRAKDVQIVVGEPGGGKTTALVDMASLLAKMGFVPVLLELRGRHAEGDLFDLARERFLQQVRPIAKVPADAETVWLWLWRRQRTVILVDDIDQLGFDGEPGFHMRRIVETLASEGLAVIATARPAGVPAGIAASAIDLPPLRFETAVDLVAEPAAREPGATTAPPPPRARIERWIRAGDLTRVPLYLEILAELSAVGACPDLPSDPERWAGRDRPGRWRKLSERERVWNPDWVRYMLLDHFYEQVVAGEVRRSLGIESFDRKRSMSALEDAALGQLGAGGLAATARAHEGSEPGGKPAEGPRRTKLVDFISTDDRGGKGLEQRIDARIVRRRPRVSQHEATDAGMRLRILALDSEGELQFRHRILQAFFAGRRLAEIGRQENEDGARREERIDAEPPEHVDSFASWVATLMDQHHPEKLTAHLALTFAAIHADERSLRERHEHWDGLGRWIARRLVERAGQGEEAGMAASVLLLSLGGGDRPAVLAAAELPAPANGEPDEGLDRMEWLDPMVSPDPHDRKNPDDEMTKLTTAASIVALLKRGEDGEDPESGELTEAIVDGISANEYAMSWTKLRALPAIAALDTPASWRALWEKFTPDLDYEVRREASRQLEENACTAYPRLKEQIDDKILRAGLRASRGQSLQSTQGDDSARGRGNGSGESQEELLVFMSLGWVLPPIVSGLSEELRLDSGFHPQPELESETHRSGDEAADEHDPQTCFPMARRQLEDFAALAYEGGRHELEESLAQGFKADAMRHASEPGRHFKGPGWVASNRRLVADVALPHAESWYARKLLYQALALYAVAGASRRDTLDMLAYRLRHTRERHPLARQAAKLSRAAVRLAQIGKDRWDAFVWDDEVVDAGHLPAGLSRRAAQLVGDVALLVDLKEGSPPDRHRNFGHMEELPHCLSVSRNRHEILGTGCPEQCGWGFCPYRAISPDEPSGHRGLARGFCRAEGRRARHRRRPAWQRKISSRRLREFWQQMEFKARR